MEISPCEACFLMNMNQNKAPEGFEPSISCLLDRRFNQLSHGANLINTCHNAIDQNISVPITSMFCSEIVLSEMSHVSSCREKLLQICWVTV